MNPKVSFVVPVYNVPDKFLNNCIISILKQTEANIEVLLIDDGSTDNSGDICDIFSKKDNRISVIHQHNKGLSGARNTGVRNARGKYITFVDGDDWVEPDLVESLLPSSQVDVVIGKIVKDFPNRKKYYQYEMTDGKFFSENDRVLLQKQILNFQGNISTVCGKLINREYLIKNAIYHDEKLSQGAEGIEFNFRLFELINSSIFVDRYIYHYVYDTESITTNPSQKNVALALQCFEKIQISIQNNLIYTENMRESLLQSLNTRLLYFIVTTAISSIFNPKNSSSYREKKDSLKKFMKNRLIDTAFRNGDKSKVGTQRQIILSFIKFHLFYAINILGKLK
ncbi:glycosyltransferase family 2 protein (plasmid) [Lactiplantibacillus plantarum]|uniref:glycosyltransferase family 2 protein n=1 Tax=Lactiplantibacillus plantarum TaxID=1590 RepID=UPI000E293069|nr:glycosyltransferase family 2 protein [Lactiplantibacillus plantarum]BBA83590.1 glycosyl transferase [Lactiplantibacillus plantarum]